MTKTKEIKSAGFCIVRPELVKKNIRVAVGNTHMDIFHETRPHAYRWLNDDEDFQVFYQGRWQEAESVDFDFLDDEKAIMKAHFKTHTYSGAMEEIKQWSVKELKEVVRHCGYKHTYTKDILIDMVQDLARIHAWKIEMTKKNPFLNK